MPTKDNSQDLISESIVLFALAVKAKIYIDCKLLLSHYSFRTLLTRERNGSTI